MKKVRLTINNKEVHATEGENLLWVALDNGIYIPNLCAMRESGEPAAGCRLCFVEVAGREEPVTACTETATGGMVVNTRGANALRLARTGFDLIMASHPVECARCPANRFCELQKIATYLKVSLKPGRLRRLLHEFPLDASHPLFVLNPNKCVLCGRCVRVCREKPGNGALGFAYRGFNRVITTFAREPLGVSGCDRCGECVKVCPTGALFFKDGGKNYPPHYLAASASSVPGLAVASQEK